MNLRNFFAELKRRNVYKVAVAYAVVSWLLIQAAIAVLFPIFEMPNWVMKVFVVAADHRLSGRARLLMGLRDHAGRNQA